MARKRRIMYARKTQSWLKYGDFIFLDLICLQVAFVLAYMARHGMEGPFDNEIYVNLAAVYTLADILVAIANRSMLNVLKRGFGKELEQSAWHVILVALIVSLYMFSVQTGILYSRITYYLISIFHLMFGVTVRMLWKRFLIRNKQEHRNTAIYFITTEAWADYVLKRFMKNSLSRTVQGMCILDRDCTGRTIAGIPVTSSQENLIKHLCEIWVDEVFLSLPEEYPYPTELMAALEEMGIVAHVEVARLKNDNWHHQVIEELGGTIVRTISMKIATPMQAFLKRALDIVGGLVGCVITGLLILIIGPMIYYHSPGPIFFSQIRVGKNGRKFKLYKFRSMYLDAEERKAELMAQNRIQGGLMFKLDYDPRIIGCEKRPDGTIKKGIGNFIRDYSLDEFPQFFNVLKGDLSLCGTRPPTVDEWEKYELHHHARLAMKPGITGLWQVSGRSNITDFEQVVALDKKYIREWSMGLDFRILLQTVKVVLGREGSM